MARRTIRKQPIAPDPVFGEVVVSKFVNQLMWGGKKSAAEGVFYGAMKLVGERAKKDPMEVFKEALDNVKPRVEVKSRRVGGATYQVPVEVRPSRREMVAIKWIIRYSRDRNEKGMGRRLAGEVLDAASGQGNSVKKREDTHRMAEANKAFAHYRW